MTNSPQGAMPGAYSQSYRDIGAAPSLSGAKSHIFQPPRTPSTSASSSLILTSSTAVERPQFSTRKRTLEGYEVYTQPALTHSTGSGYRHSTTCSEIREGWMPGSPKPFVNTMYECAGGMETPVQTTTLGAPEYSDIGYRKHLSDGGSGAWGEHEGPDYFDIFRERNGRPRLYSPKGNPGTDGWGKAAIQVAGVVVGKVWEFCKTSSAVFKGFQAGGGQAYTVTNGYGGRSQFQAADMDDSQFWEEKSSGAVGRDPTALPGEYPRELEFIPDYMDRVAPDTTPPRPTKRRQISSNHGELISQNWVYVAPTPPSRPQAQPKTPSRYSMPTASSAGRRTATSTSTQRPTPRRPGLSRVSHAGSPALSTTRGASFASPRSPASASRIPVARASTFASTSSPTRNTPTRNIALASGNVNGNGSAIDSPATREAARWAALKKKEEREADESIRRLDRQLKDLIREGKEALGTRIEVDIVDDTDFSHARTIRPPIKKWGI